MRLEGARREAASTAQGKPVTFEHSTARPSATVPECTVADICRWLLTSYLVPTPQPCQDTVHNRTDRRRVACHDRCSRRV